MKKSVTTQNKKRKTVVFESTDKKKMSVICFNEDDNYTSSETKQMLYEAAEHVGNDNFTVQYDVD